MSLNPPSFFFPIRNEARENWDALEAKPKLAGPWYQLFMQVKSPKHVLSELLQNADDAGATWVNASIVDDTFRFVHNGEDFNAQSFSSLCNFGYSNKRTLHTIGFRGIGFKSVFSLGPEVQLSTPTMSFAFHEKRFTEPFWVEGIGTDNETIIQVKMDDPEKNKALEDDFLRWQNSSVSLLFFNHIKKLTIQDEQILRDDLEEGPVSRSRWVSLNNNRFLLISSQDEPFPQECIEEIKKERGMEHLSYDMPPCSVQIVLGSDSQPYLYTVLPTEIKPLTPFSFNAPFITDPARIKIKALSNSQTNRWLLDRIGKLTADTLIEWLENSNFDLQERANAYALLPDRISVDGSIERECSAHIVAAMDSVFEEKETCVLCNDGSITSKNKAIALPGPVLDTWGDSVSLRTFAHNKEKIVARIIDDHSINKMERWGFIEAKLGNSFLYDIYRRGINPPCPKPLINLTHFWSFILPISNNFYIKYLPIVPVAKKGRLFLARMVLSAGNTNTKLTEEEWTFLVKYADLIDPQWLQLLAPALKNQDNETVEKDDEEQQRIIKSAKLYQMLDLHHRIGLDHVINNVAENIFKEEDPGYDGITIAHIAAKSNIRLYEGFKYLCRDGCWRTNENMLIAPEIVNLDELFPSEWLMKHVISDEYTIKCPNQDIHKWREWSCNHEKSRLYCFPIPQKFEVSFRGINNAEQIISIRGGIPPGEYKYKGEKFILEDYDWEKEIWSYWDTQAQLNPEFLLNIGRGVVCWYIDKWKLTISAVTKQQAAKHAYNIDHGNLCSNWLMKVKSLRCLPDSYGFPMTPAELMRTTPDTGPLSSVERFIHKDLDNPKYAEVLELLGVRGKPAGIGPLLDRLQALSNAEKPPISALGSIYDCIDRALLRMSTDEVLAARERFREFMLIFTEDSTWECAPHVYLDNPEQIPGVRIIHHEFRSMKLWEQLNVTTRPTFEMALTWLLERPIGGKLSEDEKMRVRAIIRRDPLDVWSKSNAWLDLSGRWQDKKALKLGISRNPAPALFDSYKQSIADFTMVPNSLSDFYEYTGLEQLEAVMEVRLEDIADDTQSPDARWLGTLGSILMRLKDQGTKDTRIEANSPTIHDRSIANRMRMSTLHQVRVMKVAPYIQGELAGSPRDCMVHWIDDVVYVKGPPTQHIHELKKVLSTHFNSQSARATIEDCVYREPSWIHDYALHNLDLYEDGPSLDSNEGDTESKENSENKKDVQEDQVDLTSGNSNGDSSSSSENKTQGGHQKEYKGEQEHKRSHSRQDHLGNAFRIFMQEKDYHLDGTKYVHPNGNWITKTEHGSSFDWTEYNENGQIISLYWISYGSMREGFDIPSEIWNYPLQDNSKVYLMLISKESSVLRYSLSALKHLAEEGRVEVFSYALKVRMVG